MRIYLYIYTLYILCIRVYIYIYTYTGNHLCIEYVSVFVFTLFVGHITSNPHFGGCFETAAPEHLAMQGPRYWMRRATRAFCAVKTSQ